MLLTKLALRKFMLQSKFALHNKVKLRKLARIAHICTAFAVALVTRFTLCSKCMYATPLTSQINSLVSQLRLLPSSRYAGYIAHWLPGYASFLPSLRDAALTARRFTHWFRGYTCRQVHAAFLSFKHDLHMQHPTHVAVRLSTNKFYLGHSRRDWRNIMGN